MHVLVGLTHAGMYQKKFKDRTRIRVYGFYS